MRTKGAIRHQLTKKKTESTFVSHEGIVLEIASEVLNPTFVIIHDSFDLLFCPCDLHINDTTFVILFV